MVDGDGDDDDYDMVLLNFTIRSYESADLLNGDGIVVLMRYVH